MALFTLSEAGVKKDIAKNITTAVVEGSIAFINAKKSF